MLPSIRERLAFVALLSFLFVALAPRDAHADEPGSSVLDDDGARREFEAGREAYDAGEFGTARAHFEQAYALSQRPQLLYNVGRAADLDGDAPGAASAYERYLASGPSAENASFVRARLARLRTLGAPGARDPVLPAATGRAVSPAAAGQFAVKLEPSQLASGSDGQPASPPHDAPRAWHRSPWLWTAVGAVVAGAAVGTVLAVRGGDEKVGAAYGGSTGTVLIGPRKDAR